MVWPWTSDTHLRSLHHKGGHWAPCCTHSLEEHLSSSEYMPGTLLGAGNITISKTGKVLLPWNRTSLVRRIEKMWDSELENLGFCNWFIWASVSSSAKWGCSETLLRLWMQMFSVAATLNIKYLLCAGVYGQSQYPYSLSMNDTVIVVSGSFGARLGSNTTLFFLLLCDLGQAAGPLCASGSSPIRGGS